MAHIKWAMSALLTSSHDIAMAYDSWENTSLYCQAFFRNAFEAPKTLSTQVQEDHISLNFQGSPSAVFDAGLKERSALA